MDRPVVIITGASSGIGAAAAEAFARRNYHLVLAARRVESLQLVADRCGLLGARATVVPTDVSDEQQVEALVRRAVDDLGRIDVMVNNAGFGIHARVHQTTTDQMWRIFETNYFGVFYGCKAVAPMMIEQGRGHVFNVSSVIGKRGTPFNGAYCATKFAVCGLTDAMRVEMMPYNVRVTCVCPGLTRTEFFDRVEGGTATKKTSFQGIRGLMPASIVARRIVETVGKHRPELVFSTGGKFLVLVSALWPSLADRMMKFYHDKLVQGDAARSETDDVRPETGERK